MLEKESSDKKKKNSLAIFRSSFREVKDSEQKENVTVENAGQ